MKIILENFKQNPTAFMKSCGYAFDRQERNELSFIRRLAGADYPKFHAYIHKENNSLIINLHLDQKKPSYAGGPAHGGEYGGDLVEQEGSRIKHLGKSDQTYP